MLLSFHCTAQCSSARYQGGQALSCVPGPCLHINFKLSSTFFLEHHATTSLQLHQFTLPFYRRDFSSIITFTSAILFMRRILGLCRNLKAAPDLDSSDDMPRDRKTNVEPTLFDLQTPAHYDQEEDDVRVPGKSSRRLPHPIEPYQPEPRYTMNTAVTPRTIIPTMYFRILGIEWNDHEQAHYYDIRSIPKFGEQGKLIRNLAN